MEKLMMLFLMAMPVLAMAQESPPRIPEPSTVALLASSVAVAGLVQYLRKRRNK